MALIDMFQAEFISDTHLNIWKLKPEQLLPIFPAFAPNLILAGDIGDPDEITLYRSLDALRHRYERIIYVPGNHEFYKTEPASKKTPASVLDWFNKLDTQWDNFHFFYRRTEVIDGIRLIGATGWTTAPNDTTWSNTISREGKRDIAFIDQEIGKSKEPVLVVTHYPPTLTILKPEYRNKLTQFDYAQDLHYLFRYPLHTWIFGHVHQRHRIEIPYGSTQSTELRHHVPLKRNTLGSNSVSISNTGSTQNGNGLINLACSPYGYPSEPIECPRAELVTISAV